MTCFGDLGEWLRSFGFGPFSAPSVFEGVSNAERVAVSASHLCALLRDGAVACSGLGFAGALGVDEKDLPKARKH